MESYRYYRLFMIDSHGGAYLAISEMEFIGQNETDITDGLPTTSFSASATLSPYSPYNAFNNKWSENDTGWFSPNESITAGSNKNQWIKVDLGTPKKMYELKYQSEAHGNYTHGVKNYIIQGSNDDSNWVDLKQGVFEKGGDIQAVTLIHKKILLKSNNKTYSLKPTITHYETKMTSNTAPTPFVASASSQHTSYPAYKAFDTITTTVDNCWMSVSGVTNAWVQMDYSIPRRVNAVVLKNRFISNASAFTTAYTSPKDFDILGSNDGVNFRLLKSERNLPQWGNGEVKTFTLNTVANYRCYRVHILSGNNDSGNASYTAVALGEIEFLYIEALTEIPVGGLDSFIKHGGNISDNQYFSLIHGSKNYNLQDGISENVDGLWVQDIDRKPLSIKFK